MMGLNASTKAARVFDFKYSVPAFSPPLTMFIASVMVISEMARTKISFAALPASSAARLRDRITSSHSLFNPKLRNLSSTFFASGGNGILIFGFPK